MKIQYGTPPGNGRYVVFVRCASHQVKDWCEPEIATWHGGRWHNARMVYGWIGPLPLAPWKELSQNYAQWALSKDEPTPEQEWDL